MFRPPKKEDPQVADTTRGLEEKYTSANRTSITGLVQARVSGFQHISEILPELVSTIFRAEAAHE